MGEGGSLKDDLLNRHYLIRKYDVERGKKSPILRQHSLWMAPQTTFGLERLRKCPTIMSFIRASLAYVSGTYFAIRDEFVLVACLLWFVNI